MQLTKRIGQLEKGERFMWGSLPRKVIGKTDKFISYRTDTQTPNWNKFKLPVKSQQKVLMIYEKIDSALRFSDLR